MKLRRMLVNGGPKVHAWNGEHWVDIGDLPAPPGRASQLGTDMLAALQLAAQEWALLRGPMLSARPPAEGEGMLPFEPRSCRDFMLYEQHVVQASRGCVKRFMPGTYNVARAVEAVTRRPFPAFRPVKLWYEQPIYYMGNHLNFVTEGATVRWPSYTHALDYELELGFVITQAPARRRPRGGAGRHRRLRRAQRLQRA